MAKRSPMEMAALLAAIPSLPRSDLLRHWAELFPKPPPKGLSTRLVAYAVANELQVNAYGGLSKATTQQLLKLGSLGNSQIQKQRRQTNRLTQPGTRLMREWHGKTYIVDVLEKGYRFQERNYQSLSEIARNITGARWSGPRFFAP